MVVVNRIALFVWVFAFAFLLMVALFTALLVRDGPPAGYSPTFATGVLAACWLGGLGLTAYAASKPYVRLEITPEGLTIVTWRYPFRRVVRTVTVERLAPAAVISTQDDEGSPYFVVRALLDDGTSVDLAEGHDRDDCEAVCAAINEMLSRHAGARRRA